MAANQIAHLKTFLQTLRNKYFPEIRMNVTAQYVGVYIVIFVGLIFSFVLFNGISSNEQLRFRRAFNDASLERVIAIESAITRYVNSLDALASLYRAVGSVDHETFDVFATSLIAKNPGVQAFEWAPKIAGKDLQSYERQGKQWHPNYQIFEVDQNGNISPPSERNEYFPVYYVVPHAGNEQALGFDLGSNASRRDAIRRAASSGKMVATQRLTLVQERGEQFGFLLIAPIYHLSAPTDTEASRQANLAGLVLGVFRIGDIITQALSHMRAENIGVVVKDMSAPSDEQFLHYFSPNGSLTAPDTHKLSYARTIQIGGRVWSVQCINEPGYGIGGSQWMAWSALLNGMVITFLIAGYLLSLVSRNDKIAAVVKERTEALRQETARVSALNVEIAAKAAAFRRFVPEQFLVMLGFGTEESILEGHGKARECTVMFCDIRRFTEIAGRMSAEEVFQMINAYIGCVSAIVDRNGGFIDHSYGDGVLTIFEDARDAVLAAVELQHYVHNQPMRLRENGEEGVWIALGIGIHRGVVMAGTVGTDTRMQTSVFGDTVNIAARMQELNKDFGTKVLISQEVRKVLGRDSQIITRCLGEIEMRGVERALQLYEVVNALPAERMVKTCALLEVYEEGCELLRRGLRVEARGKFEECLRTYSDDGVSRYLINAIDREADATV